MAAEAGRGKSALVCRWMVQLKQRSDIEVIFIPISIRFEIASQEEVFEALAARLAKIYHEEHRNTATVSLAPEKWRSVCESYLDRSPPSGKQLVVILDGLDEATDWKIGAGFFHTEPPTGLRVLVTARLRTGESSPQGWASTLGWDTRLTRLETLPPLTRIGVEEVLISMGNPLNKLANQQAIIKQLYYLSEEGDPLLVKLYVDALLGKGAQAAFLRAEDLPHLKPGLREYFNHWWEGQKKQWQAKGRDPLHGEQSVRNLLNLLSAARGRLTRSDLSELAPDQFIDSILLDEWLTDINRWVIGNGNEDGYTFSHPRFGYFFWDAMFPRQQQKLDNQFTAWGERVLHELNNGELDPKAASPYLLKNYASHLERSDAPPARFYALISDGWRKAWEVLDISYSGFLNDVEQARERAKQVYDASPPGRAEALVQQVRAALCRSSVVALSNDMLPELLAHLVEAGLRTPIQAMAMTKVMTDESRCADVLLRLSSLLPNEFIEEIFKIANALQNENIRVLLLSCLVTNIPEGARAKILDGILSAARTVKNNYFYAAALIELLPYLVGEQQSQVIEEALKAISTIDNFNTFRSRALSGLVPHLPVSLLGEALILVNTIEQESSRAEVLSKLASRLSGSLLVKALKITYALDDPYARAITLSDFIPYLQNAQAVVVLEQALEAARAVTRKPYCVIALNRLIVHLPESQRTGVLEEAQKITLEIENEKDSVDAFIALAPNLSESRRTILLKEILSSARKIKYKRDQAEALIGLLPYLPQESRQARLAEAMTVLRTIGDIEPQLQALNKLSSHLSEQLVENILTFICEIEGRDSRTELLTALASRLSAKLLEQRLRILSAVDDKEIRGNALLKVALSLAKEHPTEALTVACTIEDESSRADALVGITPYLPKELIEKAAMVARSIKQDYWCARTLCKLAIYLPEVLLDEALIAARSLSTIEYVEFLSSIITYVPDSQRQFLLKGVMKSVYKINKGNSRYERRILALDEQTRTVVLSKLAPHLPLYLLQEALALVMTLDSRCYRNELGNRISLTERNAYPRVDALIELVPHLPIELVEEACVAVLNEDEFPFVLAILSFAPRLSPKLLEDVLARVWMLENEESRVEGLSGLAPYLSAGMLEEAFMATCKIENEFLLVHAMSSLVPYLPTELREKALTLAMTWVLQDEESYTKELLKLAPYLSVGMLEEAFIATCKIEDEFHRADVLVGLIPYLPAELLDKILIISLGFKLAFSKYYRAKIQASLVLHSLASLVPHPPENQRRQILKEALAAISAIQSSDKSLQVLNTLMIYLPNDMLGDALMTAHTIQGEYYRASALGDLVPLLIEWSMQQPHLSHLVFADFLQVIALRPRPQFLQDLAALMPFILAMAGDEAPEAAEGIYHAIQEVCVWWP